MNILEALTNHAKAREMIEMEEDIVIQTILKLAKYQAIMHFSPHDKRTLADIEAESPETPFDMLFYMRLLKQLMSHKGIIKEILNGNIDVVEL